MKSYRCEHCHRIVQMGEFPFCPHGTGHGNIGDFKAYTDFNISDTPVHLTSKGDRDKLLRPHWKDDYLIKVEPREKSAQYWRELDGRRAARKSAAEKER